MRMKNFSIVVKNINAPVAHSNTLCHILVNNGISIMCPDGEAPLFVAHEVRVVVGDAEVIDDGPFAGVVHFLNSDPLTR